MSLTPILALAGAATLGLLHGILPDEHTWPITFSYAIGRSNARGGALAGFLFSIAFTVQRAIAAELSWFALLPVHILAHGQFYLYLLVGSLMLGTGWYALHRQQQPIPGTDATPGALPAYMPLVHGFVAGWGTGVFAITVYTVLVPAMGRPALAFLPGFAFGLGTMVSQIVLGGLVGRWMSRRHMGKQARSYVSHRVSGLTLGWGGVAFVVVGGLGIWRPSLLDWQLATGLRLEGLRKLDIGFFLAVGILFLIAGVVLYRSLREARRRFGDNPPDASG